jgi:hypothetical protein
MTRARGSKSEFPSEKFKRPLSHPNQQPPEEQGETNRTRAADPYNKQTNKTKQKKAAGGESWVRARAIPHSPSSAAPRRAPRI